MENKENYIGKGMLLIFFSLFALAILVWAFRAEGEEETKPVEPEIVHKLTDLDTLHSEICHKVPESPLCDDIELLRRIDSIGREKGVPTRLLIGIAYSESHIGVNFNKEACRKTNNWAGIKGKKHDTGKVVWYTKTKGKADKDGCWLYRFKSVEEGFYSLANTISMGYKGCNNDTKCLSYGYVGNPNVSETSWVNHVSMWY